MARWIRFRNGDGSVGVGTLDGDEIEVCTGDPFTGASPTGVRTALDAVTVLAPCLPTKIIGLWNNFGAAADKNGWSRPPEPLWFIKPTSCVAAHGDTIRRPASYPGRVFYEGELGIVIGTSCVDVSPADVDDVVFGYTCVNDVTALELIMEDTSFAQWSRAKSFDMFAPIGPAIATGLDPDALTVRTLVDGRVRQDYPVSDMIFSPRRLVSLISRDVTLSPGDVISCGTSTGALPMRPGTSVEIEIDGIGVLRNTMG